MRKFDDVIDKIISFFGAVMIVAISIIFVILIFAAATAATEETKKDEGELFDIPAKTYICTDPDTNVQYIVVVGNNDVSICRRDTE